MTELTFNQLAAEIQEHFARQTYAEGLELANRYADAFPDNAPLLNYWRLCLAARLGEAGTANRIFEETLERGIWYAEPLLRQSPSLETLQGQPDFERLVHISLKMQESDPSSALPLLVVHPEGQCLEGDEPCPLLVFLHGNSDTARANLENWQAAPAEGWLLALPQSQQAMWAGAFAWYDHESAAEQVEEHLERLKRQYAVDEGRVALAGFSMGAEIALWLALTGRVPARGFILLGPGGPLMDHPEKWEPLVQATGRDLRGLIVTGEADDTINHASVRQLVDLLNANGLPCDLETYPGLGHEYPPYFDESLRAALDSFLQD